MEFSSLALRVADDIANWISPKLLATSKFSLLVGSYSESLATCTSDIDVFVFIDSSYEGELINLQETPADKQRLLEISLITDDKINEWIELANSSSYEFMSLRDIELLHKLINGKVIAGHSMYANIITPELRQSFNAKVVGYYESLTRHAYDDLMGVLNLEDATDALTSIGFARDLAGACIDSWLAKKGDTYPKPKWRISRFQRRARPTLLSAYKELLLPGPIITPAALNEYVFETLSFCRQLNADARFEFYPESSVKKCNGYVCDPWLLVIEYGGVFYARLKERYIKLDRFSNFLLHVLNRPCEHIDIIEIFSLPGCEAYFGRFDLNRLIVTLERLLSAGLIAENQNFSTVTRMQESL